MSKEKEIFRFPVSERLQHLLMLVSFTVLAITGLPQKFAGDGWAEAMIAAMGGIETVRVVHHFSAIVLVLVSIAHLILLGYKVFVRRVRWTMMPNLKDVQDALQTVLYNLGLRKQGPKMGRYTFGEKFEYLAIVWGTLIMALTGFILWNPIQFSQFLPGELIPAAKAAHGAEAILAVLAVLTWHFYNVHLKVFNKSMFTGKISRHEMEHEHALELEAIEKGKAEHVASQEAMRQRRQWYIPAATLATFVMLGLLYWITTSETTALTTVPPVETVQAFVPQTKTPTPTPRPTNTPLPPTPTPLPPTATPTLEPGQPTPTPAAIEPTTAPAESVIPALPANHAGRTVCQVCHAGGVGNAPKNPPDHAGRLDATCTDCHKLE